MLSGYRKLLQEINIVEILKQLRVLKTLAKQQLTRSEWLQMRSWDQFKYLDQQVSNSEEASDNYKEESQEVSKNCDGFDFIEFVPRNR